MIFEIPEGYNIISEEEHADIVRESAELDTHWVSAGVIHNGWLSEVSELAYVWTMDEDDLDGHLDDVEILVDCE